MNKSILILVVSMLVICCDMNDVENIAQKDINLNGNWEYVGFGKGITITDSIVKSYHLSSVGNVSNPDNSVVDYFDYYTVDTLSNDTILLKDGVKIFKLFRSNIDFEEDINEDLANDPSYNFEVLWNTFNEQYCYFKEREIDWNHIYKKYQPQINTEMTPLELYLIFEKMLGEVNDGHISIDLPDELEEDYDKLSVEDETEGDEEIPDGLEKIVKNQIIERYIENIHLYNRGEFKWGLINEDIGYLQVQNMIGFAHYDIADSLSKKDFWGEWWGNLNASKNYHDDVAEGTRFIMDSVVNTLINAKACIIDLRFNGGGFDDVSVEMLNHFVQEKTDMCTKKVRLNQGFTEKQIMTLYPSTNTFDGMLYILTSHQTASAAEVLVLGSKEIPNTKIVGSTTEGVFSDILRKKLPNGWRYGLSNMIYETMDGISYEYVGIQADDELDYPVKSKDFYEYLNENLKDGDEAIERIILEVSGLKH